MTRLSASKKGKTATLVWPDALPCDGFSNRLLAAIVAAGPRTSETYILVGDRFDGKIARDADHGYLVKIEVPQNFPATLSRGWAELIFDGPLSACAFCVLHEMAHSLLDVNDENGADLWALSVQQDFDLSPPKIVSAASVAAVAS